MPTPDRRPGPVIMEVDPTPPVEDGHLVYNGTELLFKTGQEIKDLLTGGGGISEPSHRDLDQLIHYLSSGPESSAVEVVTGNPFPTNVTWYTDGTLTQKIVEKITDRSVSKLFPTSVTWKVYDEVGVLSATITDTLSYSGAFPTGRVRTYV